MSNKFYIYGRKPIQAAFKAESNISKIFILFGTKGEEIDSIFSYARKNNIPLTTYDKGKFQNLLISAGLEKENHQGVIALREIGMSLPIQQLVDEAYYKSEKPVLVLLDEIQDPHNLGSIARSAESAGCAGLILPDSKSSPVTPVAFKTSAGALEYLPYSTVKSISNTVKYLKDNGFWVIGTSSEAEKVYTDNIYDVPIVLVIGNEGKGIRSYLQKECDIMVKIPTYGRTESLNASVSAGIILFEIMRQKNISN
ncbi:MAG: 23S rRNA (guanosine(2251)-2'-O)-methyltransferase RlmB [Ignavibacteria bacterium GWF2_33_9]|nr:MAG: 23S rRNA (guanosine(2251)-2'-O)-methyltransferase RlmB [Ignavibacteria bacterium GWF2_33_9]